MLVSPPAGSRRRRSRSALLVALAFLLGLPRAWADEYAPVPDGRLELRLVWCDILQRTHFPFDEMTAEVERVLGAWEVNVTWRTCGAEARYLPGEIPVVLLDRPRVRDQASEHVMGSTPRRSAVRAAWIFSSSVVRALELKSNSFLTPDQESELARALGRVVAHELVHVIAPDVPHARRGLMRPSLNRRELLRPGLTLENHNQRAFVAGLGSFLAAETPERPRGLSGPDSERLADAVKRP